MTEKQYGGATPRSGGEKSLKTSQPKIAHSNISSKIEKKQDKEKTSSNLTDKDKILKAGHIAKEVKLYARSIIKKDVSLLEIAEKIEAKIFELGGKPAFPVNLSINNIAAHYTPSFNDETKAHGLLKVDLGVQIDGWVADTAFSLDLENTELNKKIIEASEKALASASKTIKESATIGEIGASIQEAIESHGFSPVINLSGHEIGHYDLHAGISIPNINNGSTIRIKQGLYAIEPFASTGSGKIHDGAPSGIYILQNPKIVRNPTAKEILEYIIEEYNTLPFCNRWLYKKFGAKAFLGLRELERNEVLHHFPQLVENKETIISQAENTFLVEKDKVIVTSE